MDANWIFVGKTQGQGKKEVCDQDLLPLKDIWLSPSRRTSAPSLPLLSPDGFDEG